MAVKEGVSVLAADVQFEIIDSHTHLDDTRFANDRDAVLDRARDAGVSTMICVGSNFTSSRRAVTIAQETPGIYATVGVHPHEAAQVTPRVWDGLKLLAKNSRVVAWGEIGLDFHYNFSPPDIQKAVFRQQLKLARNLNLPVIIHDRNAHQETLAILKNFPDLAGVVVHCFSGGDDVAEKCLQRGYYLGIGGVLTYPKSTVLREVVKNAPLDRLLLETDCPYLSPQPWRGKRNEPAYLGAVVTAISEIKGIAPAEITAATTANARRFFRLSNIE